MKNILILFLTIFSSTILWAQLPDFELKDLEQKRISLEDLAGEKLTVIDFWATWCKPCVSALPKLNKLYNSMKSEGVEFVGVNIDGPRNQSKIKPFINSLNIEYKQLHDPDQALVNELNVGVFPTLIVFNSKGKEVYIHEGFNPGDETIIREEIEKLLKK